MAGLLEASSIIQPAYLSPHRKRRIPVSLFSGINYDRKHGLDSQGLKNLDRNSGRRHPRTMRSCAMDRTQLLPMSFARPEDWLTSVNLASTAPPLSSGLKAVSAEHLGISSPQSLLLTESTESTMHVMAHSLLNFLLEAYSSFHAQTLVATIILAAIVVVATIIIRSSNESNQKQVDGTLVILSHPSQFNRFVFKRCPSMSSNRFTKIQVIKRTDMGYQRMCLHAPDGGIVSIDWPAELDLAAEDNLANTLLLVPGTTEGSEDEGVKQFVIDAMRYGYFPVVLNPRGCASSPLTTPRVFSGADSDDVRLAVQHIARERPRSTLMGVGWGWGANILTKYLGEEAGSTSLMAAVAISNPFDLQQASMHLGMTDGGQFDQLMTKGLVSILEANKVLFVGQNKGFDMRKALASTSVREFDTAISRVTFGYDTLEEFYVATSSAQYISTVRIPLIFVQGEDDSMPVTSVPHRILEANPYTTALVAQIPASNSISANGVVREPGSASRHGWSHTVAFEWLAAVEVALLKGQHPRLNVVNPYDSESKLKARVQPAESNNVSIEGKDILRSSKDLKMDKPNEVLEDENVSLNEDKDEDFDKPLHDERALEVAKAEEARGIEVLEENGAATYKQDSVSETESTPPEVESTPSEAESASPETESTPPEESEPEEAAEAIQMRAAAESVMNVLDITMPGTLSDEKKAQVLTAVGEGETILTALQEAVPEEVRGSMATAVSGAVQARGLSFNLVGFGKSMPPPSLPAGLIDSIKGKLAAVSGGKKEPIPTASPSHVDSSTSGDPGDTHNPQATSSETVDGKGHADSVAPNTEVEKVDNQGREDNVVKQEDKSQSSGQNDSKEDSSKQSKEPKSEESKDSTESKPVEGKRENIVNQEGVETGDKNKDGGEETPAGEVAQKDDKKPDDTADGNGSTTAKEEAKPTEENQASSATPGPAATDAPPPPAPSLENSAPPALSTPPQTGVAPPLDMRLAFQALAGFDDSTQMAVTNVFGVVESMLAKLEQEQEQKAGVNDGPTDPKEDSVDKENNSAERNEKVEVDSKKDRDTRDGKEEDSKKTSETETGKEGENKKNNDQGSEKEEPDVIGDPITSEHKKEVVTTKTAAGADLGSKDVDGGHETATIKEKESAVDLIDERQVDEKEVQTKETKIVPEKPTQSKDNEKQVDEKEVQTKETKIVPEKPTQSKDNEKQVDEKEVQTKETKIVPEKPTQSKDNEKHSVKMSSSKLSNQGLEQRPQSKVMLIQRVGNCTFVEPMLKDQPLTALTDDYLPSVNGAASKHGDTSKDRRGPGSQQSKQPVEKSDSSKPIICKMTIEQLSQKFNEERSKEEDDSSARVNEIHDDQPIEVEVTDIKETGETKETKASSMIENMVKDALKLEVLRRLGIAGMESVGIDLEQEVSKVANSVAEAVQRWKKEPSNDGTTAGKLGILPSESITRALGTVMGGTRILGGLVPIGVLAGVILASLGAVYLIVTDHQQDEREENDEVDDDGDMEEEEEEEEEEEDEETSDSDSDSDHSLLRRVKASAVDVPVLSVNRQSESPINGYSELEVPEVEATENADDDLSDEDGDNSEAEVSSDDEKERAESKKQGKFMGMMAAAVTGGATLAGMSMPSKDSAAEQQDGQGTEIGNENMEKERGKVGIISSIHPLAEKALSVAAPVVPHNEDGEIDQERLVAMLAELGQRGGFLLPIGKVALLWGGLRGAMSLTNRLLGFLQMDKRPLHLRIVGFAGMVVLLWSPVLIPVLPSLLHQWATKAPSGVADAASVVGLYGAILILVTIWGKRVRGYSKPLLHYGLRFWSKRKVQDLGWGLVLGGGLVSFLYSMNFILGYVQINWGALLATNHKLPGTAGVALFTAAKVSKLVVQAVGIGLAVSLVEEVLFRAWLQEEIAVDLGFHRAVFLSAVAFALVHWSPAAMPGLWFLSVSLAGARAKMNRNLAFPIGLHAGLVASNYVMTVGGLVQYLPHAPTWLTGAHVGNPLAGALGTAMMAMLAVTLYPRTVTHPFVNPQEVQHAA